MWLRRKSERSRSDISDIWDSPILTLPEIGCARPPITDSKVDLPPPLGPEIATLEPLSTVKETPSSARTGPDDVWCSTTTEFTVMEASMLMRLRLGGR